MSAVLTRIQVVIDRATSRYSDDEPATVREDGTAVLLFGPSTPLLPGQYRVSKGKHVERPVRRNRAADAYRARRVA